MLHKRGRQAMAVDQKRRTRDWVRPIIGKIRCNMTSASLIGGVYQPQIFGQTV